MDSTEKFHPLVSHVRECRSLLLDFINSVYPRSIDEEELVDVMLGLPEPVAEDYVRRDLSYLKDRGLLEDEIKENPVKRHKARRWKLAAKGVTFIEHGKPWREIEQL